MSSSRQSLQRRFGDLRPGMHLIAIEDAALPVTMVRSEALAQESKQLPTTDEFVLRFANLGIVTPDGMAAYLGLQSGQVLDAVAARIGDGHLRRDELGRLHLTAQGLEVVRELVATQPVLQQLPIAFDRLTWSVAGYAERDLIEKKQADDLGMLILPGARNATITTADVTPAGLNALLRDDRIQVIRVQNVSVRKHRYLPVKVLVYGNAVRDELELAICIDDDLSETHSRAVEQLDLVTKLSLGIAEAEPRPVLEDALEDIRDKEATRSTDDDGRPLTIGTAQVRSVSVYEHPDLLAEALERATSRILLISPWVKGAVVTKNFGDRLERRLRSGTAVTIAHGMGADDSGSDKWALDRLTKLAGTYSNFDFVRLRNTHAKILIFDDNWVSTSFNWLSFRGDSQRTYRMEEGTLVTVPDRVEKEYRRYLQLISEQRVS